MLYLASYKIGFSQIPRYRQKHTISLHVFGENVTFYSAYLLKMHNSAASLHMIRTAWLSRVYQFM
jgi:hypothetical protein